jgi:hypothetical protein
MSIRRSMKLAIAAVLLAATGSADALAAPQDVCASLEANLAAVQRAASGNAGQLQQIDQSMARARQDLDRASAQARAAGCMGGFFLFAPRPDPRCGAMMATVNRLQAAYARLADARNRAGGDPYTLNRNRTALLQALGNNNCGPQYAAYGNGGGYQQQGGGGFFASLFGPSRFRSYDQYGTFDNGGAPAPQVGTYRTLCVRTCDGYYFPISFSTVPSRFATDQETCQSMCPGSDVALYIHRNPGQESEDMVSLTGQPYSSLATAFKYRQSYDAACTCHSAMQASLSPTAPNGDARRSLGLRPTPARSAAQAQSQRGPRDAGQPRRRLRAFRGEAGRGDGGRRRPDGKRRAVERSLGPDRRPVVLHRSVEAAQRTTVMRVAARVMPV